MEGIERKEFSTFAEVEAFFLANFEKWRLEGKATKVIGTVILIFDKRKK